MGRALRHAFACRFRGLILSYTDFQARRNGRGSPSATITGLNLAVVLGELNEGADELLLLARVVQTDDPLPVLVRNGPRVETLAGAENREEAHGMIAGVVVV